MITTERNKQVGAHLTDQDKEQLRKLANNRGKSMSKIVSDAVRRELKEAGYDVAAESE
jgi:predicted DNA-binding protein